MNSTAAALSLILRAIVGASRTFARSGASRASDRMAAVSQSLPTRRRYRSSGIVSPSAVRRPRGHRAPAWPDAPASLRIRSPGSEIALAAREHGEGEHGTRCAVALTGGIPPPIAPQAWPASARSASKPG